MNIGLDKIADELSRKCLAIRIKRNFGSTAVIDVLTDLFALLGVPVYTPWDNGAKFIADGIMKERILAPCSVNVSDAPASKAKRSARWEFCVRSVNFVDVIPEVFQNFGHK